MDGRLVERLSRLVRLGQWVNMDKETEQRIRERAYELWMQHGSLPGRADEYWYRAEQEILGMRSGESASGLDPAVSGDEEPPLDTSPAPLGMTSQTLDEVLSSPAAPKTRRRRSTTAATTEAVAELGDAAGETVVAPKRRRSRKPTA